MMATDHVQELIQRALLAVPLFPPNSRYSGIGTATVIAANGRPVVHLRRRFVPPPERFTLLQEHVVVQGDRLDLLAAKYVGDPEQFWRICDANRAMRPDELIEEIGRRLLITLPDGIA